MYKLPISEAVCNILAGKTLSETLALMESERDEEKVTALLQFLDIADTPENRARVNVETYDDNRYYIDSDHNQFLICTDAEADEEYETSFMNLVDDLGLDAFTGMARDYILSNCFDEDPFIDYYKESTKSYAQDIQSEENDPITISVENEETGETEEVEVTNRLFQECLENNVVSEDALTTKDIENGQYVGGEDLVELYCEHFDTPETLGYDDAADWYKFNFGSSQFNDFVKQNDAINWDEALEYIKSVDGRGNELNGWDGKEYEEDVNGTTYFIYPNCDYKTI